MSTPVLLDLRRLPKPFGGQKALDDVSSEVRVGCVVVAVALAAQAIRRRRSVNHPAQGLRAVGRCPEEGANLPSCPLHRTVAKKPGI